VSDFQEKYYDLACKGCGERMAGIVDYKARKICEPCGGNVTEYHEENPIPNGTTDKLRQQARA
jgi:rRNA maturation endonuclease Nob1